jgi:hypothetical protein
MIMGVRFRVQVIGFRDPGWVFRVEYLGFRGEG